MVRIRGALSLNHTEEFLWHAGLIKELVQDHDVDERTQGTNTALFVQALRCETLFVQALRYEKFCSAAFGPNVINQNWMMRLYMSFASWKFQQPQGCSSRSMTSDIGSARALGPSLSRMTVGKCDSLVNLQARYPEHSFVHFTMNETDDVMRFSKWKWAFTRLTQSEAHRSEEDAVLLLYKKGRQGSITYAQATWSVWGLCESWRRIIRSGSSQKGAVASATTRKRLVPKQALCLDAEENRLFDLETHQGRTVLIVLCRGPRKVQALTCSSGKRPQLNRWGEVCFSARHLLRGLLESAVQEIVHGLVGSVRASPGPARTRPVQVGMRPQDQPGLEHEDFVGY